MAWLPEKRFDCRNRFAPSDFHFESTNQNKRRNRRLDFDASEIRIESSNDGTNFTPVKSEKYNDSHSDNYSEIVTHTMQFDPVTARYFRITVQPSVMPDWHPGKRNRAYIFVDEIVLN